MWKSQVTWRDWTKKCWSLRSFERINCGTKEQVNPVVFLKSIKIESFHWAALGFFNLLGLIILSICVNKVWRSGGQHKQSFLGDGYPEGKSRLGIILISGNNTHQIQQWRNGFPPYLCVLNLLWSAIGHKNLYKLTKAVLALPLLNLFFVLIQSLLKALQIAGCRTPAGRNMKPLSSCKAVPHS